MTELKQFNQYLEAGGVVVHVEGEFDLTDDPILVVNVRMKNTDTESIHTARFFLVDQYGLLGFDRLGASSSPEVSDLHSKKP